MTPLDKLVKDLQQVLDRHKAAIFFPELSEVWINGNSAGLIDHDHDCQIVIKEYAQ